MGKWRLNNSFSPQDYLFRDSLSSRWRMFDQVTMFREKRNHSRTIACHKANLSFNLIKQNNRLEQAKYGKII